MEKFRGNLMIIAAAAMFGLMPFFAKTGVMNGFNTYTIILFRCLFASIILHIYIKRKGLDTKLEKGMLGEMAIFSFFSYGMMMFTLFYSYNYIPTGIATTLHFIYPAAVLVGSVVFYKEKLTKAKIIAVSIAIIGIYLLSVDKEGSSLSVVGVALALVSGILYASYVLKVANGKIRKLNSFVLVYYVSIFNIVYFVIFAAITGNLKFNISPMGYIDIIAMSFVSVVCMTLFKDGLNYVSSCTAAVLSTFEPLTSIVIGVILYGENFDARSALGVLVIIVAVIYISFDENRQGEARKLRSMQ